MTEPDDAIVGKTLDSTIRSWNGADAASGQSPRRRKQDRAPAVARRN
jgi:hypothetical protein